MILFISNNQKFESLLKQTIEVEVEYFDLQSGIIYTDENNEDSLEVFCLNLSSESEHSLTLLKCYGDDLFTRTVLKCAKQYFPNQLTKLSKVVLMALFQKDIEMIQAVKDWYFKLNPQLLDTMLMLSEQKGSITKTAQKLFIHRNTVTNRINEFEKETGIDMNDRDNQNLLEIASILSQS